MLVSVAVLRVPANNIASYSINNDKDVGMPTKSSLSACRLFHRGAPTSVWISESSLQLSWRPWRRRAQGIDHGGDEGAVPQSHDVGGVDGVEKMTGFLGE